ncbi:unnamed protein product (macronuclear) [Paramecium tetraurelia]|uniref:Uncharacterized protein n=1 Tax=Paramecium tetraurelia TaxID=5888 RepID=A0CKK4_PARTE|nr:uncharacterized protein GSPATT00001035001 [Paramecium tetraurelia]CAK71321.1 unnamed protein product [Paramecium tetraurelia]|eukprot:XP_001438718.1 hypothetical protein (macronuclear) [Paramecium tetraurelia strain d4-2]
MSKQEIDFINKAHEKFSQFILDHQTLDEQIRAIELRQLYNKPLQVESYEKEIQKINEQNEKEMQDLEKQKKELNNKKQQLVPIYEVIRDQKFPYDLGDCFEVPDDI